MAFVINEPCCMNCGTPSRGGCGCHGRKPASADAPDDETLDLEAHRDADLYRPSTEQPGKLHLNSSGRLDTDEVEVEGHLERYWDTGEAVQLPAPTDELTANEADDVLDLEAVRQEDSREHRRRERWLRGLKHR